MLYTSTLLRWLERKRYQYEVTFSLYMLTPTEKFIFNSFLFLVLSMIIIAASLYLPEHVTMMAKRAWFYYAGDETVTITTATATATGGGGDGSGTAAAAATTTTTTVVRVVVEELLSSSRGTATTTTTTTTTVTEAAAATVEAVAAAVAKKVGFRGDKVLDMLDEL